MFHVQRGLHGRSSPRVQAFRVWPQCITRVQQIAAIVLRHVWLHRGCVVGERDEAAVPEDEVARVLERVLGERAGTLGLRVQFTDRAGRSEKITLVFPEGGTITVSANTRKAGESRRALIAFLERCEAIGKQVAAEVVGKREVRGGR